MLLLLRVSIGWHFGYKGLAKVDSWRKGDKPFSAEGYLKNATGPLAPYYRGLMPDPNGLARLDTARLKAGWADIVSHVADHFGFNDVQRTKAQLLLDESYAVADAWERDPDGRDRKYKYYHDLRAVQQVERDQYALATMREWAWAQRKTLDFDRRGLTKDIDARTTLLRDSVVKLATPEQAESAGPYSPRWTVLDWNNWVTAYGLIAIGFCLMLGLFTRPAALAGAAFLTLIYLSMPPWPGLPANPLEVGHYLYVDRNVVEGLACLALACLPTGQWIGLDALLFGWMGRARQARREVELVGAESSRGGGRRAHRVS